MELLVSIVEGRNLSRSQLILRNLFSTVQIGTSSHTSRAIAIHDAKFVSGTLDNPVVISLTNSQTGTIMYVRNVPLASVLSAEQPFEHWIAVYPPGDPQNLLFDLVAPPKECSPQVLLRVKMEDDNFAPQARVSLEDEQCSRMDQLRRSADSLQEELKKASRHVVGAVGVDGQFQSRPGHIGLPSATSRESVGSSDVGGSLSNMVREKELQAKLIKERVFEMASASRRAQDMARNLQDSARIVEVLNRQLRGLELQLAEHRAACQIYKRDREQYLAEEALLLEQVRQRDVEFQALKESCDQIDQELNVTMASRDQIDRSYARIDSELQQANRAIGTHLGAAASMIQHDSQAGVAPSRAETLIAAVREEVDGVQEVLQGALLRVARCRVADDTAKPKFESHQAYIADLDSTVTTLAAEATALASWLASARLATADASVLLAKREGLLVERNSAEEKLRELLPRRACAVDFAEDKLSQKKTVTIQSKSNEIGQQVEQLGCLEVERFGLTQQLMGLDSEIRELRAGLEEHETVEKELRREARQAEEDHAKITSELRDLAMFSSSPLQDHLADTIRAESREAEQRQLLRQDVVAAAARAAELEAKLNSVHAELALGPDDAGIQRSIEEREARYAELQGELRTLEAKEAALRFQTLLEERCQTKEQRGLSKSSAGSPRSGENLEESLQRVSNQLADFLQRVRQRREKEDELRSELQNLKKSVETAQETMAHQTEHDNLQFETIQKLAERKQQCDSEVEVLATGLHDAEQRNAFLQRENSLMQQQVGGLYKGSLQDWAAEVQRVKVAAEVAKYKEETHAWKQRAHEARKGKQMELSQLRVQHEETLNSLRDRLAALRQEHLKCDDIIVKREAMLSQYRSAGSLNLAPQVSATSSEARLAHYRSAGSVNVAPRGSAASSEALLAQSLSAGSLNIPPHISPSFGLGITGPQRPLVGQQRRKAVLVGSNYASSHAPLKGCVNDVWCLHGLLRHTLRYGDDQLRVLVDSLDREGDLVRDVVPTKANILSGLNWLVAGAQPGDNLLFFFSGYGAQHPRSPVEPGQYEAYLVPVDFAQDLSCNPFGESIAPGQPIGGAGPQSGAAPGLGWWPSHIIVGSPGPAYQPDFRGRSQSPIRRSHSPIRQSQSPIRVQPSGGNGRTGSSGGYRLVPLLELQDFVCRLPPGCRMTVLLDCCYSALPCASPTSNIQPTFPRVDRAPVNPEMFREFSSRPRFLELPALPVCHTPEHLRRVHFNYPVCVLHCFSACHNWEWSVELLTEGTVQGAFTWSFLMALARGHFHCGVHQLVRSQIELLSDLKKHFKGWEQTPMLQLSQAATMHDVSLWT